MADLRDELNRQSKELNRLRSENAYMARVQEKSKVFAEDKAAKELEEQQAKNNSVIDHYAKKVISIQIDLEGNKLQHDDVALMKEIDIENTELVVSYDCDW